MKHIIKSIIISCLFSITFYTNCYSQKSISLDLGFKYSNLSSFGIDMNSDYYASFKIGGEYRSYLGDKTSFSTGLYYSKQGYTLNQVYITTFEEPEGSGEAYRTVNTCNYFLMPFMLGYKFGNRFAFVPKIGFFVSLATKWEHKLYDNNNNLQGEMTISSDKSPRLGLGGLVNLEFSYAVNDKNELFSTLFYTHELISFKNSFADPFSFGSTLGFRHLF